MNQQISIKYLFRRKFILGGIDKMENRAVKTTILNHGFAGEVTLEEMQDGRKYVHKAYTRTDLDGSIINDEWDALFYLYNKGYSVPKPIERTKNGMYIQYIENGALWDTYKSAEANTRKKITEKFAKLLYDLHILKPADAKIFQDNNFLQNEIAEISQIIDEKGFNQLNNYIKIIDRLETISANITEQAPCYIHRDYHPWNVLSDKNGKQYAIDFVLKQGDYRFDVAWTYMMMTRTDDNNSEFLEFAEHFLSEYVKLQPDTLAEFVFFKQLANLRWLVNVKPPISSEQTNDFFQYLINIAESVMSGFIE